MSRLLSWHNALFAVLAIMIGLDFLIGLDPLLNAISIIFVVLLIFLFFLVLGGALVGLGWLTVRQGLDDIRYDGKSDQPWRYRLIVVIGFAGVLIDGVAGGWAVFRHGIAFSTAVEHIPLSGLPIYLLIASFPVRWIEEALIRRRGSRIPVRRATTDDERGR